MSATDSSFAETWAEECLWDCEGVSREVAVRRVPVTACAAKRLRELGGDVHEDTGVRQASPTARLRHHPGSETSGSTTGLQSDPQADRHQFGGSLAPRTSVVRVSLIVFTLLVGACLTYSSWRLQDADAWLSNLLVNVAVFILLLIPGEFLLVGVRRRFDRVEKVAIRAEVAAGKAQETADETARSLGDIRDALIERQHVELQDEIDTYRRIVTVSSRDSLLAALRKATQDDLITTDGVRVPVWETEVHYRYVVDDDEGVFKIQLEHDDGSVISVTPWDAEVPAEDFYQSLVNAVREAGHDLGTGLNVPTESVEQLASMLVDVTRLRSQELAGYRDTLRKIIERRNGAYFTEKYVIPSENLGYCIDVDRLGEMDWEDHLRNKGWTTAPDAIRFARRLYGTATSGI